MRDLSLDQAGTQTELERITIDYETDFRTAWSRDGEGF